MNVLIVGGTSGLGLSLAKKLRTGHKVHVTGRRPLSEPGIEMHHLDLSQRSQLETAIEELVAALPAIDVLIYAAGFFQDGTITEVTVDHVNEMVDVGLSGAVLVSRSLLIRHGNLAEFIAITSTSQWTPRLHEPVYTAVKAGLAAYANSLALDPRVGKTLVVGPAGMATNFWQGTDPVAHDTATMLDPDWVAEAILGLRDDAYSYKFAKILRQPARVEVGEVRQ